MDNIDCEIISILRNNARTPISSISYSLNISRATVRSRINRLTSNGIIQSFTIQLKKEPSPNISAIVMIEVEGSDTKRILNQLKNMPGIYNLYSTNGRWDIVAKLNASTLEKFDDLLKFIRQIKGIRNTETSILLTSH